MNASAAAGVVLLDEREEGPVLKWPGAAAVAHWLVAHGGGTRRRLAAAVRALDPSRHRACTESVRVKTGLFCSISEMFWDFLSFAIRPHN